MSTEPRVRVYLGESLGAYQFGPDHPFGSRRYPAFVEELDRRGLRQRVQTGTPALAPQEILELFHDPAYLQRVRDASESGEGLLDLGDTPAFRGVFEAASTVVGTVIAAIDAVMAGDCDQAFVPIAGLHHARRDAASGFCVFNDPAIAIEYLRARHDIGRIAYVDIDAHHADGVFYAFENDPLLFMADFHEDGRFLYPGTGSAEESGTGAARATKLNIPLPPGAGDTAFFSAWPRVEEFLDEARPEFVILQCGADSLEKDPLTHLAYSTAVHAQTARRLKALAERHCKGRLVALGGGGYQLRNLSAAWCEVIAALVEDPE